MPTPTINYSLVHEVFSKIVESIQKKSPDALVEFDEETFDVIVRVNAQDQGRFVGKQGKVVHALEVLAWYIGIANHGRSIGLRLMEPSGDASDRRPVPLHLDDTWDRKAFGRLLDTVLGACLKEHSGAWVMDEIDPTKAVVRVRLEKYLKEPMMEPNFAVAFGTVMSTVAKVMGANVEVEVYWK